MDRAHPSAPLACAAIGSALSRCGAVKLAYAALLIGLVSGGIESGRTTKLDFGSIEGQGFFASDGGLTVGWIHYLAFDLFVGLWIARDADAKVFSRLLQVAILLATFLVGPLGLLLWLGNREKRAKALGRGR